MKPLSVCFNIGFLLNQQAVSYCELFVVNVFCQYIQDGEVGAEAVEAAGGHCKPHVTQDVVDWSPDARHGQSRNCARCTCSEICQIPAACLFV